MLRVTLVWTSGRAQIVLFSELGFFRPRIGVLKRRPV